MSKVKKLFADMIIKKNPKIVGIYRLTMKSGSDNFRESAIQDIIKLLKQQDIEMLIYEPMLKNSDFEGMKIEKDLEKFKEKSDVILVNRNDHELDDVWNKVYTRDLFSRD